jgi:acetyltransferase
MEAAGVPMFNDVEEMAEAAGLLAQYPTLRAGLASASSAAPRLKGRPD